MNAPVAAVIVKVFPSALKVARDVPPTKDTLPVPSTCDKEITLALSVPTFALVDTVGVITVDGSIALLNVTCN
ncbi:hypothetical protein [Neobacillus endophyticus]|uniref:hypothetical protein n=1 Tax=Neobacillus endophyticus TaxID=2738405 RepID=UPI001C26EDCB|nr:hypothetical protein [Neobacillus endophyticus]